MRRSLFFLLLAVFLFCTGLWRLSDGFSVRKIRAQLPYDSRWEVSSPSKTHLDQILSQSFSYIGKGSQCFVFESEDKHYVLKFFRLSRYHLPSFQEALSLPPFLAAIQNARRQEKQKMQEELFTSCTLAYKELKEECGLIYLHLNKTTHLNKEVLLHDNLHRPFTLSLDQYAFLIQKKGEPTYAYLSRLMRERKQDEITQAVNKITSLLYRRASKEILDRDPEIHKNTGFYEGKPYFLDVGQFYKGSEPQDVESILQKLTSKLDQNPAFTSSKKLIFSSKARFKLI